MLKAKWRRLDVRKYVTLGRFEVHAAFIVMAMAIMLLTTALAVTYYTQTINHHASIGTDGSIEAYSDASCTQVIVNHDWGTFDTSSADDTKNASVYVKNLGNLPVNVTWAASNLAYDTGQDKYVSAPWTFYMANGTSGTIIRPENDTSPSKTNLDVGEVAHFRFFLTAAQGGSPTTLDFQTHFLSKST